MPKRIQMTRQKPWRKDNPDAVIVDRRSKFGNPFQIGNPGVPDAATAVALFTASVTLCDHLRAIGDPWDIIIIAGLGGIPWGETIRQELRGRDLACWCALDAPCHADALLEWANK